MPQDTPLSTSSQHAENKQNDPSRETPSLVIIWTVPEDENWEFEDGETAVMTTQTTADNNGPAGANADPSPGTDFGIAIREKNSLMNQWRTIGSFEVDPFNVISQVEQMSEDKAAESRRISFDGDEIADENGDTPDSITLEPGDQIALVTNGDDKINAGETYFRRQRTVYDI